MTTPTPDRTPTADLRERLAEALTREHYRRARERIEASLEEHCAAFADAVLPVFEAETAALRRRIEEVEDQRDQALAWQDTAERERDDYRQRFANQMTAATELTTTLREAERKLQQALEAIADERRGRLAAEAAVRRAQALADRWSAALGVDIAHARALREALDAEGRQDETLAAVEQVRRMAQVWIDIRPQHPTATTDAHTLAWAGEQIIAALDAEQPEESPPGQESAVPVDWEAIVRQRERELKHEGEARHQAETAVQRVQAYALWCDQHDVEPDTRTINAVLDGTDTYPYGDHVDQPKEVPPAEHTPGANAEDCPACSGRRDLPYPFICPGTGPAAADTEDPVQCRTCESYILPDGIGWRHALGPADHTPEPAPDAEETR